MSKREAIQRFTPIHCEWKDLTNDERVFAQILIETIKRHSYRLDDRGVTRAATYAIEECIDL